MVIPFKSKYLEIRHLLKESWAMGWPMILIMFFQFAIGLTDVYVAGFLGTDVLAAVGYVAQLYWTLMIMANGLSVGTVSMVSQAYGAKSSEGVGCITANSLLVGLCVSGVLTVIAQLYPASIVRLAGMPEGIQVIAESFIRVFSLVLVPTYAMIITGGVLRSSGRIHITMINSLVAASVNVVGELVLSFGWGPIPAMGYIGIAWGTAIATTLGMVAQSDLRVIRSCSGHISIADKPFIRMYQEPGQTRGPYCASTDRVECRNSHGLLPGGTPSGGGNHRACRNDRRRTYRGDHIPSHLCP